MTSPDVFSWLRGLKAGNWPGRDAAYAHPAQVRLWPLALDVIRATEPYDVPCDCESGPNCDTNAVLRRARAAFFAAAEKERA